MKVHHIGYAVKEIEPAISKFVALGFSPTGVPCKDEKRNVIIQFMEHEELRIELISPLKESSPVSRFLAKAGNSPYHFCFEVEEIDEVVASFQAQKYLVIEPPNPSLALGGRKVAFLFNKDIGLIELLEKTPFGGKA